MPNELKPCPFCGGKATLNTNGDKFWVDCAMSKGFCRVMPSTWQYKTEEDAIEAWNERC